MSKVAQSARKCKGRHQRISAVAVTTDCLTGRAGLVLVVRYLDRIGLLPQLEAAFGMLRKKAHGVPVRALFRQLFCFLIDGTSRHMTHFDQLARDEGYARVTESHAEMVSSHQVKRFFGAFGWLGLGPTAERFRGLLRQLAIWRIRLAEPGVIVLGLDSMVMDNHEARRREGVTPTYKRVRGFHPLQLTWERFVIDADFRQGKVHCNHGDGAYEMIAGMVEALRQAGLEAPVIVRLDAGFYDKQLMSRLETAGIAYLMGGRLYQKTRHAAMIQPKHLWQRFVRADEGGRTSAWRFVDLLLFNSRWGQARRTIYSRTEARDGQCELALDEATESLIYTNIRPHSPLAEQLEAAGRGELVETSELLRLYHGRGSDELVHRHMKAFASEQLPFKRFALNAAYYYVMLLAFFVYEAFKQDVTPDVIDPDAYPNTIRRRLLDVAGKLVRSGNRLMLKVTQATWEALEFDALWKRANAPPTLAG